MYRAAAALTFLTLLFPFEPDWGQLSADPEPVFANAS
jgi:hypothetical protein